MFISYCRNWNYNKSFALTYELTKDLYELYILEQMISQKKFYKPLKNKAFVKCFFYINSNEK